MRCLNRSYAQAGDCPVCHMKLMPFKAPVGGGPQPLPAKAGLRAWPELGGRTAVYFRPYAVRRLGVERRIRAAGPLNGRRLSLRLGSEERRGLKRGGSAMVLPAQGSPRPVLAEIESLGPGAVAVLKLSRALPGSAWALAELRVQDPPSLAVPLAALIEADGSAKVFVMDGEGYAPRSVTVTARGEDYASVEGLEEGETVAGSGVFWLEAQWHLDHP